MDDERLKSSGGGNYWKELLDRIRDIRSSEKVLYRQVIDLYATSIDYNPKSTESVKFFKTVQNKLHYATNKQTAAETINERANAKKDFMGLTIFAGPLPTKAEATIAKNSLKRNQRAKNEYAKTGILHLPDKANFAPPLMRLWQILRGA